MKHVSKKGFTLTEMMIVIAIIVIIAGAVAAGIAIDINRYNSFLDGQKAKYADGDDYMHDDSLWEAQARREVHNIYDSARESNEATRASDSAAAEESEAAAASKAAKASESAAALASASNAAASSAAASSAAASSAAASSAAASSAAASSANTNTNSGNYVADSHGNAHGVVGVLFPPTTSGNVTHYKITDLNGYNSLDISITKEGSDYIIDLGNAQWNIGPDWVGDNHFPEYVSNQATYTLTPTQKNWLTTNYHISFS